MTGFTPDVSQGTLIRTGLLQGFGIGCVFVPLSTVAFGTLAPSLRTQATGLFNLMRNVGASIGISLMSYLLVRNSAIAQSVLVEHVAPYRQVVRDLPRQLDLTTLGGRAALAQIRDRASASHRFHRQFQANDVRVLPHNPPGSPSADVSLMLHARKRTFHAGGL
jgi:hypothetical protein